MITLDPSQIALIIAGIVGLVLAVIKAVQLIIRAASKQYVEDRKTDSIKSRAEALEQMSSAEATRYLLKIATQAMESAQRIRSLETALLESLDKNKEYQTKIEALTAEVLSVRLENAKLQNRIIELEVELKGKDGH